MDLFTDTYGAVDIGGTKIAVGLVTATGQLLEREEFPTNPEAGPLDAINRITSILKTTGAKIGAIGIGCTGPVDPLSGTIGDVALLPGWQGFPLTSALQEAFNLPVALENDCDAAALAEATWGSGNDLSRFLFVSLSTGIGAGLILDGKIYRGANGTHPEPGHMTIDPTGPNCYCGAQGCWETLASGTALAKWHNQQTEGSHQLSAHQIFALARTGDPVALQTLYRFTHYLGIGLANLTTLYAPNRIALGGGLMASQDLFLAKAQTQAFARTGLIPANTVTIVSAAFGSNAGLLGAGAVAQLHVELGKLY